VKRRWIRTSTLILLVVFVAALTAYLLVRPRPATNPPPTTRSVTTQELPLPDIG